MQLANQRAPTRGFDKSNAAVQPERGYVRGIDRERNFFKTLTIREFDRFIQQRPTDAARSIVGVNTHVGDFQDSAQGVFSQQDTADGPFFLSSQPPTMALKQAHRFVTGDDILDFSQPSQGRTIQAPSIGLDDQLCEVSVGGRVVFIPGKGGRGTVACQSSGWNRSIAAHGLFKVDQFGDGAKTPPQKDPLVVPIVEMQQALGQPDVAPGQIMNDLLNERLLGTFRSTR